MDCRFDIRLRGWLPASPIGPNPNPALKRATALYATPTTPIPFRAAVMQPVTKVPFPKTTLGMRSDFKQQSASRKHGHTVEHGTCRVTVDMRLGNARERFKKTKITVQSCGTMVRVGFRPRRWVFVACAGAPARVATRVVPRVGQIEREVWVICLHLVVVHLRWGGGRPQ